MCWRKDDITLELRSCNPSCIRLINKLRPFDDDFVSTLPDDIRGQVNQPHNLPASAWPGWKWRPADSINDDPGKIADQISSESWPVQGVTWLREAMGLAPNEIVELNGSLVVLSLSIFDYLRYRRNRKYVEKYRDVAKVGLILSRIDVVSMLTQRRH